MSIQGTLRQENVRSGKYSSGNCPPEVSDWDQSMRSVSERIVRIPIYL